MSMFEAALDVKSEEYVMALQNYAVSIPDVGRAVLILSKAKSVADLIGLQDTHGYKTIMANLEVLRRKLVNWEMPYSLGGRHNHSPTIEMPFQDAW